MGFIREFWVLFQMQLANWRWAWKGLLIGGIIVPLSFMFFLQFFANVRDPDVALHLVTGNIVISLLFTSLSRTASRFAFLKETKAIYYYRALLDSMNGLVLATMTSFLLLTLPGVVITLVVGKFFFALPIALHPLIFLTFPLSTLAFASLGALIGLRARNYEAAGVLANLINFVMAALGPIVIPVDRLPTLLRGFSWILPSTYVALAFRQTLTGQLDGQLPLAFAFLTMFSVITLYFVNRNLQSY